MTYKDPITHDEIDQVGNERSWDEETAQFAQGAAELETSELCASVYAFLDGKSVGPRGTAPSVPLCKHAVESYVTDHSLLTSAVAYCLGYELKARGDSIDLGALRLAALTHEFPHETSNNVRASFLSKAASGHHRLLNQAWRLLDDQARLLEAALASEGDSLAYFVDHSTQLEEDLLLKVLYHAHLAVSSSLGDRRHLIDGSTRWVPSSREKFDEHPLKDARRSLGLPDEKCIALVYGGATKIKSYVFESAKLPDIRGASVLLDRINLLDLPALFGREPGVKEWAPVHGEAQRRCKQVREPFAKRTSLDAPMAPECILYANGGNILAFIPPTLAGAVFSEIEHIYAIETLVANSACVADKFTLLELQYGLSPTAYWIHDYQRDLQDPNVKPLLEAYYGVATNGEEQLSFLERKTFGEVVAKLTCDQSRRREARRYPPHFETIPHLRRCHSCDRRGAIFYQPGREEYVCEPCLRKYWTGQVAKKGERSAAREIEKAGFEWRPLGTAAWIDRFHGYLQTTGQDVAYYGAKLRREDLSSPDHLDDIAAVAKPKGYIGVIYGDGNNMGGRLEAISTPAEYRQFAIRVYRAVQAAVFEAVREHISPTNGICPFELLSVGGDDVFLIVPGHAGLPIASAIARNLEKTLGRKVDPPRTRLSSEVHRYAPPDGQARGVNELVTYEPSVNLSAGVIIADAHTPVFFLKELVDELLRIAKRKAKMLRREQGHQGGTVDFLALKSTPMIASGVKDFRDTVLSRQKGEEKLRLTACPYTLPEIDGLLETLHAFKESGFPRSQLQAMHSLLFQERMTAELNYLYFRLRLKDKDAESLAQHFDLAWHRRDDIPPWRRVRLREFETVLGDLLAIYDFLT